MQGRAAKTHRRQSDGSTKQQSRHVCEHGDTGSNLSGRKGAYICAKV